MIIKELKNPLTQEYFNLKNQVFREDFPWFISMPTTHGDLGKFCFSHNILARPEIKSLAPKINSTYFNLSLEILSQIVEYNNLQVNSFMRISVNLTINHGGGMTCDKHYDHLFPHRNLLIYLNQAAGPTIVFDSQNKSEEYFHPKEDAIITFEGEHAAYQPNIGEKRIVLVATYI